MVGGVNIANRYNDMPGRSAWLDFALLAEGEIVLELCVLCWKTWHGFPQHMDLTPCEKNLRDYSGIPEQAMIRMRRNDWVRQKNQVSETYLEIFSKAQSQILILCSYFLPGNEIRRELAKAIERGVRIRIVVAGSSDVAIAKNAERYMYDWLLRNHVEIYEYKRNILHGKIAVCDDVWMTVGSYNVNNISAYASIELNLDVYSPPFAREIRHTLEKIINDDCISVTTALHRKTRNISNQFLRWLSYQFIRITFYLFTFYFKQRR